MSVVDEATAMRIAKAFEGEKFVDDHNLWIDSSLGVQQQARPWVGLTEQDLEQLCAEHHIIYGGYVLTFAKDIEAKLKSKNI
jgi:hypothetical protein